MNNCDYEIFWEEAANQLKTEIGEKDSTLWFSRISYERSVEKTIILSVPSGFIRDQVRQRYEVLIENKLLELLGEKIGIEFEVKTPDAVQSTPHIHTQETAEQIPVQKPAHTITPSVNQQKNTVSEKKPHPNLTERYSFDKFVIDNENPLPANAAIAVAKNPGKAYNPLLIYGGVGLGKTHLMQAIGNDIHRSTSLKVLYTTAENFTNEFIELLRKGRVPEFKNKYRNADVLLIDDIHFFGTKGEKAATQEELFHTFNALYESQKQIVFTCDRPVEELKSLSDRLRSRFSRGLNVDLKIPTYEIRCAILFKKIEENNLDIPKEVVHLLAKNISSNVRDLESALTKLRAYSELTGPITLEIAQRLMQDVFGSPRQHNLSIDTIQKIVADYFNISFADIKGKKRTKNISFPRQVAMYLAREMTDFSTTEIGVEFGGRDHTTIMHGHQKIETQISLQASLEVTIAELKKRIANSLT